MDDLSVGRRIAVARRLARMSQEELARRSGVSYGMVKAVEQGVRAPREAVLAALAETVGVDSSQLSGAPRHRARLAGELTALSAVIATHDSPEDGPVRSFGELRGEVARLAGWRLSAQYSKISRAAPGLLSELARAAATTTGEGEQPEAMRLMASAYRSADAVAFKAGAHDLSARLVDVMRWASTRVEDPQLHAATAYVRTETFFAARAHQAGLRALEQALDQAPPPRCENTRAARGALHMRAAVIAGRAGDKEAATEHLDNARSLADQCRERVYSGTVFGPDSVRVHEVSVAVGLGDSTLQRALDITAEWAPPRSMTAERRSGFYIDLARAQLWAGRREHAYESLQVARRIAPQHTRSHPWVREDIATLRRILRGEHADLSGYLAWCEG